MSDDDVTKLYDATALNEWERLAVRRTEFAVTFCALDEFLPPPPARILDIGSGPGRYAIRLAERGYAVSLFDVSQQCLDLACEKAEERGVAFEAAICGSALDLSRFPSGHFSAVLLMGPLYHLKSEEQRMAAVREAVRVNSEGGVLFSAYLTRFSVVRYAAKVRPEQLAQRPEFFASILSSGVAEAKDGFLQTCYCEDPAAIRPFMERLGIETIEMVGCEGIVAEVEERLNALPEAEFARWVALNYQLGRKPELLAASAHILHVGRGSIR